MKPNLQSQMRLMFSTVLAMSILGSTLNASGQRQVTFNNRVAGVVDARVTFADGPNAGQGVGAGYTAQRFGGADVASLTALNPATTFRTSSAAAQGYVNGIVVDVPGIAPGNKATVVMKVFDSTGFKAGESAPITITLGGGVLVPANLEGMQPFTATIIPEPSTIALAALGLGALLLRRRK